MDIRSDNGEGGFNRNLNMRLVPTPPNVIDNKVFGKIIS